MFFSITKIPDIRFPNNYQINNLWINCDNGWIQSGTTFYKGYDENYCKIIVNDTGAIIKHSTPRSFPLWHQEGIITNIDSTLSTQAWSDDAVNIDISGKITVAKSNIDLAVPKELLTIHQAQERIRQLLDKKLKQVPNKIKLFCSGGLDTLLLYSMFSTQSKIEFELLVDEHYEQDKFTKTNQSELSKFWGYKQIHHWSNPTWIATGSHGDEYFLRGPLIIAMLTAWNNINFSELLANNPDCYHYYHFNKYTKLWKDSWDNRHQLKKEYPTVDLLHRQIINILVNDHQHWHLGNTLTWTPYKDINIAKILLQCDINELIPQFLDGQLSKNLIVDYNPDIINYLSKYKNYNSRENLPNLIKNHHLTII